jgi:hypothetical protein
MGTWGSDSDGNNVSTTSEVPGLLSIYHNSASKFVVTANEQLNEEFLEVKKVSGESLSQSDSLVRETWTTVQPAVPKSRLGHSALSRVGNGKFSNTYFYHNQPTFEMFTDGLDNQYIRYGYNNLNIDSHNIQIYPYSKYHHLENGNWNWGNTGNYSWTLASSQLNTGVLELMSNDSEVAHSIFMVDDSSYQAWVVQYENDYPVIWFSNNPVMDSNDVQQPHSDVEIEAPSIIENQTWITHIESNVYMEFEFTVDGELTAQKLIWDGNSWQPYDGLPAVITSWDVDADNYVTFDLDGRAYKLQIMTGDSNNDGLLDAEHAIAVWERNLGEPMVWLTDRPTFH